MEFKVKEHVDGTHNEVIVTPTDDEGLFVFRDEYRGIVAVAELALHNFPGEIQRDVNNGDLSRIGNVVYVPYDNDRLYCFGDVTASVTFSIPGSANSVSLNPRSVQEMAPVAAVTPDMVIPRIA